jgi:pyridoxal phosphate-dependent aminotransferase EpsN
MGAEERRFVEEAFATNWVAPVGPHLAAFEAELCAECGVAAGVCVSSGTAALHLAVRLAGVRAGDEVFCPTFTFIATANPILYEGARPVFIDAEEDSWNLDPALLAEVLAERARRGRLPRAVIVADIYGQCAQWKEILAAVEPYGVPVIEDAAEAAGATYGGRWAGGFGAMGIFSFNGNKIINTSGGGMLVSNDTAVIEHARKLATQARDPAPHYEHSELGYNYRLSNVLAGIGRGQLRSLPARIARRHEIFACYQRELGSLPGVAFMPELPGTRGNRWLTCLTIDPEIAGADRSAVLRALEADNIEGRPLWKPLHAQPLFRDTESVGGAVADRLFAHGLSLPSGSAMTDEDLDRVVAAVRSAFPGQ